MRFRLMMTTSIRLHHSYHEDCMNFGSNCVVGSCANDEVLDLIHSITSGIILRIDWEWCLPEDAYLLQYWSQASSW